jgi:hypothetical protein
VRNLQKRQKNRKNKQISPFGRNDGAGGGIKGKGSFKTAFFILYPPSFNWHKHKNCKDTKVFQQKFVFYKKFLPLPRF